MKTNNCFAVIAITAGTLIGCNRTSDSVATSRVNPNMAKSVRIAYQQNDRKDLPVIVTNKGALLLEKDFMSARNSLFAGRVFVPEFIPKKGETYAFDWQTEDRKIRPFLDSHTSDQFYSYYRQHCALKVITNTDLLDDSSTESLAALAYYTELLDAEKSPNPAVLYVALNKLKGYWSPEKIRSVGSNAVVNAQTAIKMNNKSIQNMTPYSAKSQPEDAQQMASDFIAGYQETNHQIKLCTEKLARLIESD